MIDIPAPKELRNGFEMPRLSMGTERLAATLSGAVRSLLGWIRSTHMAMRARSERRTLRVAESVSLGDKRAVCVIEVDGQRLLLGVSAGGVTLLSQLPPPKEAWQNAVKGLVFNEVMESCASAKPTKRRAIARREAGETT